MKKFKEKTSSILMILCLIALALIMAFNAFIFISSTKIISIILYAIIVVLMLTIIWSFYLKNETLFKLSVVCSFLVIIVCSVYFLLTKLGVVDKINSFQDIKDLILKYKGWGLFTYCAINFLQVVLIPIPSTLTILAGTAIFGPLLAFIFASLGIMLGSIIAFLIGRFCSKPLLYWIFGKQRVDKYEKILSTRTKLILFLTLFLPFFPDDMICMLAGITNIKFKDFIWISLLARSSGIAVLSFFGSGKVIPFNTGWGIALWSIIAIIITTILVIAFKKRKKIVSLFVKNKDND